MREDELEKLEDKLNSVITECYYLFCDYDLSVTETVSVLSGMISSMLATAVDKQELFCLLTSMFGSMEKTMIVKTKGKSITVYPGFQDEEI